MIIVAWLFACAGSAIIGGAVIEAGYRIFIPWTWHAWGAVLLAIGIVLAVVA
jgi:hypothetical protein